MNSRWGKWLGTVGASLALVALVVPLAFGAEVSRTEYVQQVEPICKTNVHANKRIFKGAKEEVKAGELKKASRHFFRAATAFGKTIRQIAAVSQPAADQVKLDNWLDILGEEKSIVEKIGRALAAGQKGKAQSLSVDLNRNSNKANNSVLSFGFDYCRIDPARFG